MVQTQHRAPSLILIMEAVTVSNTSQGKAELRRLSETRMFLLAGISKVWQSMLLTCFDLREPLEGSSRFVDVE